MKKNLIALATAGVVVISVGLILVNSGKHKQSQVNNQINNQVGEWQNAEENTYVSSEGKTLKDFMSGALGQNVVCEFSHEVGKSNSLNGVAYISENKVRVDYEMKNEVDGQKDLHMISDGEYGYMWGNSTIGREMQGMKINMNVDEDSAEEDIEDSENSLDYEMPMIDCRSWNPDMTLFEIPDDIEFVDMEEMQAKMEQDMSEQMGNMGTTPDCSICESLPEEQKSACLEGLGCE